jgi:opacity protein-like surface antigen
MKPLKFLLLFICLIPSISYAQSPKHNWKNRNPTIQINYGLSEISLKNSSTGISNAGMLELRLGYTYQKESIYGNNTVKYNEGFSFLGYASDRLIPEHSRTSGLKSDLWKFGFGNKSAYGIDLNSITIIPYTSGSFVWSRFSYVDPVITFAGLEYFAGSEHPDLNDFNDAFRFGSQTESGISFQFAKGVSIDAEYERSLIFPRHLFGKYLGSTAIEAAGLALLDGFTRSVLRNNPVAGSIVNFLLKSGYSYGIYELRSSDMNWPFETAAPLNYNTFKIGLNFTF